MLKKSTMFSEVNTEDLRVVAQALEEVAYFKGDRVFDINYQGDNMFVILKGKVGISIHHDPEATDFVATLEAGECFGEMGMLDDQPRSATAHVLEDAKMLALEKARLRGLIIQYPELALGMMRSLSLRLRSTNAQIN